MFTEHLFSFLFFTTVNSWLSVHNFRLFVCVHVHNDVCELGLQHVTDTDIISAVQNEGREHEHEEAAL
jgi:hypothetical protein